jgi:hypothetical protein
MDAPFALPRLAGAAGEGGWAEETVRYRVQPRAKPAFKTILDARALFGGASEGSCEVKTRTREAAREGEVALEISVSQELGPLHIEDRFEGARAASGIRAHRLERRQGSARREEVDFGAGPIKWPLATYPEVLLPFLMRGQPRDGERRAAYSWTADRFVARVYYEVRGEETVVVPAGRFRTHLVWMYPDLNDWVALGSLLTRLAKPFLPRYEMWFEADRPHRVVKYEGAYGPPGAPEIVLELAGP